MLWYLVAALAALNLHAGVTRGGEFVYQRGTEPASLNPIVSDGHGSVDIQFHVIEPLLERDLDTYAWRPALADRWRTLPDGRTYEFHVRNAARWSDGRPVTSADVKFSYDVLFNPAFPTAHMRPYYAGIERVDVIDRQTVRFRARDRYFGNFLSAAAIPVVPKHVYDDVKRGPFLTKTIVGSGPYRVRVWERGVRIVLERNPRWWGSSDPARRDEHNFDRMVFRFVGQENVALEMLKRGEIDFMPLSADAYAKLTGDLKGRAFKARVENKSPKASQIVFWNLDRAVLRDAKVRRALAHLMDRPLMIEKFYYGLMKPATGPWYRQSAYADPRVEPIPFDPARALALLREAGWEDTDGDHVLEREIDGVRVPLRFTIITPSKTAERYLSVFQQDARRAGVDVRLRVVDLSLMGPLVDHRQFDAVEIDWSEGLVDVDPQQLWHSKGGIGNVSGFADPTVDRLLERAHSTALRERRLPLLREVYRRVADAQPAMFLFNEAYLYYAFSRRVGRPRDTFGYDVGVKRWWIKPEAELAQVSR